MYFDSNNYTPPETYIKVIYFMLEIMLIYKTVEFMLGKDDALKVNFCEI